MIASQVGGSGGSLRGLTWFFTSLPNVCTVTPRGMPTWSSQIDFYGPYWNYCTTWPTAMLATIHKQNQKYPPSPWFNIVQKPSTSSMLLALGTRWWCNNSRRVPNFSNTRIPQGGSLGDQKHWPHGLGDKWCNNSSNGSTVHMLI